MFHSLFYFLSIIPLYIHTVPTVILFGQLIIEPSTSFINNLSIYISNKLIRIANTVPDHTELLPSYPENLVMIGQTVHNLLHIFNLRTDRPTDRAVALLANRKRGQ